jgi:hypothetical protein
LGGVAVLTIATERVYTVPLVIAPPTINKYYALDLAPRPAAPQAPAPGLDRHAVLLGECPVRRQLIAGQKAFDVGGCVGLVQTELASRRSAAPMRRGRSWTP